MAGKEGGEPIDFDDPAVDYEQLALHIMVKFRSHEPLQVISCGPHIRAVYLSGSMNDVHAVNAWLLPCTCQA